MGRSIGYCGHCDDECMDICMDPCFYCEVLICSRCQDTHANECDQYFDLDKARFVGELADDATLEIGGEVITVKSLAKNATFHVIGEPIYIDYSYGWWVPVICYADSRINSTPMLLPREYLEFYD